MPRTLKEAAVAALLLALLCACVYGRHAVDGGFISDSWPNRSVYVFAPHGGFTNEVGRFLEEPNLAARPLYAVYLVVLNAVFGPHMGYWFAWLGLTNVLMALSLYLLLRKLDFSLLDAFLVSALVLIFPAASSIRFWAATVQISAAVTLALLGFLVALKAFDTDKRHAFLLHCGSIALFVSSLLFYEAALPAMLVSILLYRLRVPWRKALPRWLVDLVVLTTVATVVAGSAHGAKEVQTLSGMWHHANAIFGQTWTLLAVNVLGFNSSAWYVIALVALLPLAAGLVVVMDRPSYPSNALFRRSLTIFAASGLIIALGYVVFVPGIDLYVPLGPGNLNRINAVPAIGWVLMLYALLKLAATLAFRHTRGSGRLVATFVAAGSIFVGVGWVKEDLSYSDAYISAYREDARILATVQTAIPNPRPGGTIWTFGQPVEVVPGVPVFGNYWDMTTSVQLQYGTSNINSYVAFPGMSIDCRARALIPGNNLNYPPVYPLRANPFYSSYGRTYFIDTSSGRFVLIRSRKDCVSASESFEFGPVLAGEPTPSPSSPAGVQ